MDIATTLHEIPKGPIYGLLTLLPLVVGLLAGLFFNDRTFRRGIVIVTAWVLTLAALLLFAIGAVEKRILLYTPSASLGEVLNGAVMVADFAVMLAMVWFGLRRKSWLVTLLALAQIPGIAYLEIQASHHPHTDPVLNVDWLSIAMVMIISIIGSIVTVYALPYMKEHERHLDLKVSRRPRFFLLLFFFLGAMNGLVMSNSLLWLCFFWEVTTLCSFLLIGHDGTEIAMTNAYRALWMNLIGGVSFVAALVLIYNGTGAMSVSRVLEMAAMPTSKTALMLPMALLCLAGFTKAAQMPFHTWLLGAMVAPTPVSALLHSSTMVKAGVYLIIRFAPVYHGTHLSYVVAIAGSFTFVAGAMLAIGQTNAKRLLAYSTISNLGLIVACAGLNTPLALAAAVMLIVFHAISKGLLFMATGVVEHSIWSREIEQMQGLVERMPVTTFLMIIGILSMLLPPFGVLIAKLAAIEASVQMPFAMVLLVIGSTLTVVFWTKWMGRLLMADPHAENIKHEHLHSMYFGPLLLLASGAIVFSLFVVEVLTRLVDPAVRQYYHTVSPEAGFVPLANNVLSFPWTPVFVVLACAVILPTLLYHMRRKDVRSAYMCGEQVGDSRTAVFRGVSDVKTPLEIGGYYFENLIGEQMHSKWVTTVAVVLVVMMFGAVTW